jgi:hypothetical protein
MRRALAALMVAGASLALLVWLARRAEPPPRAPTASAAVGWTFCDTDWDCPLDRVCRTYLRPSGPPAIRVCIMKGVRGRGERCTVPSPSPDESCTPPLLCNLGRCGEPCRGDGGCPAGGTCVAERMEPSCVVSCESDAQCRPPEGCVPLRPGVSICARAEGIPCWRVGCDGPERCDIRFLDDTNEVLSRCVVPCDVSSPCDAASICEKGECRRRCRLGQQDCPPGQSCSVARDTGASRCVHHGWY